MLILGLGKTAANTACNLQQIEILDPLVLNTNGRSNMIAELLKLVDGLFVGE